ncbi:uncharacterized protein L969DRAFT_97376 [Mixia osmundae IAM 14324]|uniref:Uncharacterized protein n=1 Tax=Mixia osmundae (strain CBS 9802 / IAM 14324 / JCM 22182 / KY 12970) TaxID=764103 RepID=G7DVH0_MIXOS|nr:uncharacterized protein L969DRAFT_97376 [Mixia osmundae IAM 14324]KEI36366.1 hypothetical protein L969DRAFT_97376 [Mixia osmundae IAM 14324]GAA94580.1 hypothetical protein E5Q_01232 [Mixia osmundae IAM 14324]
MLSLGYDSSDSQLPSPSHCVPQHDAVAFVLSLFIILGLVGSYIPQHYRIISTGTGEGISPWFLLLGATSSASSFLNVVVLQWSVVRCCEYWSPSSCFESVLGIIQVGLQFIMFSLIFVLFLIYFPTRTKWVRVIPVSPSEEVNDPLGSYLAQHSPKIQSGWTTRLSALFWPSTGLRVRRESASSDESDGSSFDPRSALLPSASRGAMLSYSPAYRLSVLLGVVTLVYTIISAIVTILLLSTLPRSSDIPEDTPPSSPPNSEHASARLIRHWATFLGVMATLLALCQYLPQLWHTARTRLVGSLSIPMMLIQTPGSFIFVYSLAVRPGVNWTSWAVFLITGVLQGTLLVMCIFWKTRQKNLGIDDYGRDLDSAASESAQERTRLLQPPTRTHSHASGPL